MTPHLEAKLDDYADVVLLPGDPLRAKWLAETFLDDVVCVNRVRNMLGFTGRFAGQRVSVQGTGMGQPSLAIYCHELLHHYKVRTLVRVGSCGGLAPELGLNSLVMAMTASTDSGINRRKFGGIDFAPCANWQLAKAAQSAAEEKGVRLNAGGIFSSDVFYSGDNAYYEKLVTHGVLAVEMETNTLYTLAGQFGARALTLLAVSDIIGSTEQMTPLERQTGLTTLAELALQTVSQADDEA